MALFALAMLFLTDVNAQISFGVKAGSSIAVAPNTHYTFANRETPRDEFIFNVTNASSAIYLGMFAEIDLNDYFFLRTEALYNQFDLEYMVKYTRETQIRSTERQYFTEKIRRIDLPVSLGVRLGNMDVTSGLVARYNISNKNELSAIEGFKANAPKMELGFQTGVGINIANASLGLNYQIDFRNYGNHISINGDQLDLQNRPTRLVATIAYRF